MSEQIYSDMARKTGKSLRLPAIFRQIAQTWRDNQAQAGQAQAGQAQAELGASGSDAS